MSQLQTNIPFTNPLVTSTQLSVENATVNPAELSLSVPQTAADNSPSFPLVNSGSEKPFKCSKCPLAFARNDLLNRHQENRHGCSYLRPSKVVLTAGHPSTRFSLSAVKVLDDWLAAHQEHPYPSLEEKSLLVKESGLTTKQVNTWFANARRRQLDPMARYISSSSEDEVASIEDIRIAAETMALPQNSGGTLGYSPGSENSFFSSPANHALWSPPQPPEGTGFSPPSSFGSAFDQCPQARRTGPPRRGRKKYAGSAHSSRGSAASARSDIGSTANQPLPRPSDMSPIFSYLRQPSCENFSKRQKQFKSGSCEKSDFRRSSLETHMYSHTREQRKLSLTYLLSQESCQSSALAWEGEDSGHHLDADSDSASEIREERFGNETLDTSKGVSQHGTPKSTFQCTFCYAKLSEKAWKRHEESQHMPRRLWTCMPSGNPVSPTSPSLIFMMECVLCKVGTLSANSQAATSWANSHIQVCSHRAKDCVSRSVEERTFYRKDHLIQHLKRYHSAELDKYEIMQWETENPQLRRLWGCGFCGQLLANWDARAAHIAIHFRQGFDMNSWDSSKIVFDEAVETEPRLETEPSLGTDIGIDGLAFDANLGTIPTPSPSSMEWN